LVTKDIYDSKIREKPDLLKSSILLHQRRKSTGAIGRWWFDIVVTKAAE